MIKYVNSRINYKSYFVTCIACALTLVACGGGGGSSSVSSSSAPPSPPILSADQKIYEDAELNGGSLTLDWNLPYGGGNLVTGTNYLYSSNSGGLTKSPASSGPLLETQIVTSLDSALSIPTLGAARYLNGSQILVRSATADRRVSYIGTAVQIDYIANDGATAVESALFNNFVEVPLTGIIDNSPVALQSSIPVDEWVTANNFAANAKWLPGSFYTTRQGQLLSDTYTVVDCPTINNPGSTSGSTPNPCATGATLSSIFPMVLYQTNGHPFEADAATDGQFTTVQGLPMWIANQPLALAVDNTPAYRFYFALNGNVYGGVLLRKGTSFGYQQADGSVVSATLQLNSVAVSSIQQGFISGASTPGSSAGIASPVATIDLFGIGGHAINGALSPQDLFTHYDIPSNLTGAGQIIAIVDGPGSGDFLADMAVFNTAYGLPACTGSCFQQIDLSNGAAITGDDWGSEIALDMQMVHAIAPGAQIVLVTAASGSTTDLLAAINRAAAIPGVLAVSMSFGVDTSTPFSVYVTEDQQLLSYQQQGVAFFASSGDNGFSAVGPSYPGSSPVVTAVGGTTINSVAWNPIQNTDTAWSFSGGGPGYTAMQTWQSTFVGSTFASENSNMRAVPDVSAVADFQHSAFAVYHKQRWVMSGGTSASSPFWAGIAALLGQQMQSQGKSLTSSIGSTTGGFSGLLYQAQLSQGKNPALRFVTSGNNNIYGAGSICTACIAYAGYSDVTGLGTPDVTQLINAF